LDDEDVKDALLFTRRGIISYMPNMFTVTNYDRIAGITTTYNFEGDMGCFWYNDHLLSSVQTPPEVCVGYFQMFDDFITSLPPKPKEPEKEPEPEKTGWEEETHIPTQGFNYDITRLTSSVLGVHKFFSRLKIETITPGVSVSPGSYIECLTTRPPMSGGYEPVWGLTRDNLLVYMSVLGTHFVTIVFNDDGRNFVILKRLPSSWRIDFKGNSWRVASHLNAQPHYIEPAPVVYGKLLEMCVEDSNRFFNSSFEQQAAQLMSISI